MRLQHDFQATQIHGRTGQEVADCILPADTEFVDLGLHRELWDYEANRPILTRLIRVDGFLYRVRADAVNR